MPDLKHTEKGAVPMLPRYFHYIEPTDPLNGVLNRFMHGKPLTEADRLELQPCPVPMKKQSETRFTGSDE
jgi:hypothetical protein